MNDTLNYTYGSTVFKYQIFGSGNDKFVSIIGAATDCNELEFPEEINGIPVTTIAKEAFSSSTFTAVSFHRNIQSIGELAFYNSDLEKVNFSEGLKEIGVSAFSNTNVENIVLPNSLKTICDSAFEESPLTTITFGKNLEKIGNSAFSNCNFTSFSIPDSVKIVGEDILFDNLKLKSLHIGKQAKITDCIADCCMALEEISINPSNPHHTVIDNVLYTKNIDALIIYPSSKKDKTFKIPKSVKELKRRSFSFCRNLKDVYISNDCISGLNDSSLQVSSPVVHCRPNTVVSKFCSLYGVRMLPITNSKINEFVESLNDDVSKDAANIRK